MKKLKIVVAIILALTFCLSMVACAVSKEDVIGTWRGEWVYQGKNVVSIFTLNSDGTFNKITTRNGAISSIETGTYEIEGNEVSLYTTGEVGRTVYKYKGGCLYNADHKHVKQ